MPDCIFCDIVRGDRDCSLVHEDEDAVAFLDLYPVHAGHTLVVPRTHVADLTSCPPELAAHLFAVGARLAPGVVRATTAQGFNIWTANGRAAGQEIFHLHLHILPRYEEDTFGLRFPKGYPQEARRGELDAMAEKIRTLL
jgi:histidine triad (HIT) family protein